jgi:hypothetical protein
MEVFGFFFSRKNRSFGVMWREWRKWMKVFWLFFKKEPLARPARVSHGGGETGRRKG